MYSDTSKEISVATTRGNWAINWGAVFASLVFIYAVGWLLFTFSSAIGLSIVEIPNPHDTNIKSESLAVSIALYPWIIGTIGVTYFLGGWLAGELSGSTNEIAASLHGVVVWSCTIVIAVLLGAMGVNSLLSSAAGAVKTTATVGMNLPGAISSSSSDGALSQLPSSFQPLMASLKQGIKKANSEQKNSSSSQNDDNESRRGNDSNQVNNDSSEESKSSTQKNEGSSSRNNDGSSSEKSNNTDFASSKQEKSSSSEVDINESPRENDSLQVNNDSSEESNSYTQNNEGSSSKINDGSASKNSNNTQEVNSNKKENRYGHRSHHSEDRIDPQALSLITVALIQGDVKQAKELFGSNTELDEKQIDELLNSVKLKAEKLGNEIEKKANAARQYASAILWLIFISYIVALIASIFGARCRCGARYLRSPVVQHTK